MAKVLKKILRKIPLAREGAKVFYDWNRERRLQSRIKTFLKNEKPPFTDTAPDFYNVGYEPTIRCNLKCKMCYQGQTRALRRAELETNEVLSVFEKLKDKIKSIKLVGGEPFVRNDILELVAFWDKNNKRVILQTNCTLINENNVGALKKFRNISDIATSLDGPREIHDAVRGVPGTFDKLEKAVKLIKENMPDVPITVFATMLVWDNIDNFFGLIDACKKMGIGTVNVLFEQVYPARDVEKARTVFREVFGWKEDDYRLNTQIRDPLFPPNFDSRQMRKKLSKIRAYGLKKGCFINFVPFNYYNNLDKYLGEKPARAFCLKLLSPELRINQKGEVIWCDIIEKSFGNLLEKSPDEIWLSEEYQKFRKYLFERGLPVCHRCCKASYVCK